MPDLSVVFLIGLLGSAHCVGMCGGFALACAHGPHGSQRRQLLYFAGKTLSYTLMGLVAGAFGAAVGHALSGVQSLLSIGLGLFLVAVGLGLLGVLRRFEGPRGPVRLLSRLLSRLTAGRSGWTPLGLGLVNGLLPCGLVYALLAKAAATGSVLGGGLTMAVFGLSTIPALFLLSAAGFLMRPSWRLGLNRAGGVLVILLGLLTALRGTPALDAGMSWLHGPAETAAPAGHHH